MLQPFKISLLTLCLASSSFASASGSASDYGAPEGSYGSSGPGSFYSPLGTPKAAETDASTSDGQGPALFRQDAMISPRDSSIPADLFLQLCAQKRISGWKKPLVEALKERAPDVAEEIELRVGQAIKHLLTKDIDKLLILNGPVNDLFRTLRLAGCKESRARALKAFAHAIDPELTNTPEHSDTDY